jgi:predicted MPP superfamily phosphohydrolase
MRPWYAMLVFLLIISSVVGGVHYYLYARLVRALALGAPDYVPWLFALSAVALPAGMMASRFLPRSIGSSVALVTFTWMGLVVLTLFLTLGSELIRGGAALLEAARVLPSDPERRTFLARVLSSGIGLTAVGLGVYGIASVRAPVEVKPVRVGLRRFPKSLDGFRIVQLTDVHIGPTIDGTWLRGIVERVNALEPDIVAITGDLVDGSVAELRAHVAPLAQLRARHGVYFVTGNHEYYSGVHGWVDELRRLGIRVLHNEHVVLRHAGAELVLAGVPDYSGHHFDADHGSDPEAALRGAPANAARVLLAHQPRTAPAAARAGFDLQLSGHTHGGQFLPWTFFVPMQQPYTAGLHQLGRMQVYVSRGTGYWGPPKRLGAPSEIAELRLAASG